MFPNHQSAPISAQFVLLFLFSIPNMDIAASTVRKLKKGVPVEELVTNPICLLAMERGQECNGESENRNGTKSIKWYFDPQSLRCLAFGYTGCGGNANRFDSMADCHKQCELNLPSDYAHCAGGEAATARKPNGRHIICAHSNSTLVEECPNGFRCQMLFAYGVCCDKSTFEIYNRNYHPKCGNGSQKPLEIFDELNQVNLTVLGKRCEDDFCPEAMECHQMELFAHCCPKL